MYCYGNSSHWVASISFIKDLLPMDNLFLGEESIKTMEAFHWAESVKKVLEIDQDEIFIINLTNQIVETLSQYTIAHDFIHYLEEVTPILFERNFSRVWQILGDALITKDYVYFMHLKDVIGTKNGWLGGNGALFENPEYYPIITEWCRNNQEKGLRLIANMMPLGINKDGNTVWHPFSRSIIDEFGRNTKVLGNLSANMGTYGTTGSRIPYLTTMKTLLLQLKNHSIENVRKWAQSELKEFEKQIKLDQLNNEQDLIN